MDLTLNGEFLDKTREKANKAAIAEIGEEDGKDVLLYDIKSTIATFEVEDNQINVDFETEMGYISVQIPLDTSDLEKILSMVLRKMNKIKSLLESLK